MELGANEVFGHGWASLADGHSADASLKGSVVELARSFCRHAYEKEGWGNSTKQASSYQATIDNDVQGKYCITLQYEDETSNIITTASTTTRIQTMAVAIKMDELLVNWLGDDSMYENVMNLIEENKLAAQKQQEQEQQKQLLLQAGSTHDDDSEKQTDAVMDKETSSKDSNNNSADNDSNSNASPRCVIPKFYLVDPSRPRRRRRLLPMPQSDTWEPLPENEQQTTLSDSHNNKSQHNATTSGDNHELPSELATVPSTQSNSPAATLLCVREQVQAVFAEIGIPPQAAAGESVSSDVTQHSIPVQEFVRVTKEIFRFPTFFNSPLCQRLLHLWRIHKNMTLDDDNDDITDNSLLEEPAPEEPITYEMVEWYWLQEMEPYDAQERFFRLCKQPSADFIVRDDFLPFIKALLNDHPVRSFILVGVLFVCLFVQTLFCVALTPINLRLYKLNSRASNS